MGTFSNLCCDFDGTNDHCVIGDVAPFQFERTDAFSVSAWVRSSSTASFDVIVSKLDGSSPFPGWEFGITAADNGLFFQLISNNVTNLLRVDALQTSPRVNDSQWHHVVASYDGSSTPGGVNFYVDGDLQTPTTVADSPLSATIATSTPLQIGARDGIIIPFQGRIDDVGIYDKVLSAAEVTIILNGENPADLRLTGPSANLVGYWTMGDGDTYPNLRDRQVASPALAAASSIRDRSSNSNDGTPTNMEDADFRSAILASEAMPDLSGNGNDGTPTNMEDADFTTDAAGGASRHAATLDGTDEYVTMGDVLDRDFNQALTISAWVKTTDVSGFGTVVSKRENTGDLRGYELSVDNSTGFIRFDLCSATGSDVLSIGATGGSVIAVNDGEWHHVAVAYTGSPAPAAVDLRVDGVQQQKSIIADTLTSTTVNAVGLQVGARDGANNPFDGAIDDVAIWDTNLGFAELQAIHNGGSPVDPRSLGSAGNILGYWGMGDASAGGVSGNVADFDGVNEYVSVGNVSELAFDRLDPFTLMAWIKTTQATAATICSKLGPINPSTGYDFYTGGGSLLLILSSDVGAGNWLACNSVSGVDDGEWHHVAVVHDGTGTVAGCTFYKDGVAQSTVTTVDALTGSTLTTAPFEISRRAQGSPFQYFDGQLDGVSVYDKALSLAEVQAVYNSGAPTDATLLDVEPNLVGYWLMGASNVGVMTSMVAGDIVVSSAGGLGGCEVALDAEYCADVDRSAGDGCTYSLGGAGDPDAHYKMRGQDDGVPAPGYVTWTSGTQDFDGIDSGASSPAIVGTLIPGSVRVVSRWFPIPP